MPNGKIWTQRDRYNNEIYLTHERWNHITDSENHPELASYQDHARETIRNGRRQQHPLIANAYKYYHEFDNLPDGMNHVVVVVIFNWRIGAAGQTQRENFIVTAYFQFFWENKLMNEIKYNYDREADVLYIGFARSEQVVSVELSDNLILRLDLRKENGGNPRAIGMTILFPAKLLELGHSPLTLKFERLRKQSVEVQNAVWEVLSQPPVSEILSAQLTFTPAAPTLPELVAA